MATVPSPITWVTGVVVTASQLNTNIRDAVNFLLTPPLCVMRQTVAQSCGASGYTAVTFDTEDIDRDGGHSTVTNTSRYTAQTAGWYDLAGTIVWPTGMATTAGFWVGANWRINGTSLYAKQSSPTSTANLAMTTVTSLFFNVGDYGELLAGNGTSGAATLASSDGVTRAALRWISS